MPPLHVRFLTGPRRNRHAVFSESPVRVGRSRENDLVLPDVDGPRSSGHHAEFQFDAGSWWVVDVDSTNGTLLNGAPVRRARIEPGDRLSFGDDGLAIESAARSHRGVVVAVLAVMLAIAAAAGGVHIANRGPLDRIAAAGSRSVFLLVIQDGGRRIPVGTAFAIDAAGHLGTNAHVATPLAASLAGGAPGPALAMREGEGATPRRITRVAIHPDWHKGSIENDVAIVTLEPGPALEPLALATPRRVEALQPGMMIAMFGFPAAFTDSAHPRGGIAANVIRSVSGTRYLIVGLPVSPGASGSPVFAEDGVVIGIIAGSQRAAGSGSVEWSSTNPAVALTVTPLQDMLRSAGASERGPAPPPASR